MKKIVCFGDSNTYGYEPLTGGRYPEDVRWTGYLKRLGFDVRNEGQNGRQIPAGEWMIEHARRAIRQHAPFDLLCVMLGSNDLLMSSGSRAEDVTESMQAFLEGILQQGSPVSVLLIAPPAMRPGEWVYEQRLITESVRMADCYRALADKLGIRFADAGQWNIAVSFDGVHFTPDGHSAFARGLEAELKKIFAGEEG